MAVVLDDCYLSLGGTTSYVVQKVSITVDAKPVDATSHSSGGWTEYAPGLKEGSIEIEAIDSQAIRDAVWTALTGTGTLAFVVKQTQDAVSASNPTYSGTAVVSNYGVGGSPGDLAKHSWKWPITGAVTKATS